jgi:hypothetical protein
MSVEPLAEIAAVSHCAFPGTALDCQVLPEFVEVYTPPNGAAPKRTLPSADELSVLQDLAGANVGVQFAPELVEA